MTFFKIILVGKVVSVGTVFLKWNENRHRLFVCDVDEGQFVQTYDEKNIYRDVWMKSIPPEVDTYPYAKVEIISEEEYEELLALLNDGEEVTVETVIQEPERPVAHEEVQAEKPMSIAEMREIILQQQQQINSLMEKVN